MVSATLKVMPTVKSDGQTLADKTVCLKTQFGILGNSRRFSNSKIEVDADKKMIKVSKLLLDSEELENIRRADNNFRAYLWDACLPYETGLNLVPLGKVMEIEDAIQKFMGEREKLVAIFKKAYQTLCENAERRLRGVYDPRNYPPVEDLDRHFYFKHRFISLGVPGQLKDVAPALFRKERDKAAKLMAEAASDVTTAMREMTAELVSHLADRLSDTGDGSKKRLHETTVKKLQSFLKDFDIRNVMDDVELKKEIDKLNKLIGGVSVEELRTTDTVRDKVRVGLEKAKKVLDGMIEETSRKFRDE